jgi:hypothetical protein
MRKQNTILLVGLVIVSIFCFLWIFLFSWVAALYFSKISVIPLFAAFCEDLRDTFGTFGVVLSIPSFLILEMIVFALFISPPILLWLGVFKLLEWGADRMEKKLLKEAEKIFGFQPRDWNPEDLKLVKNKIKELALNVHNAPCDTPKEEVRRLKNKFRKAVMIAREIFFPIRKEEIPDRIRDWLK